MNEQERRGMAECVTLANECHDPDFLRCTNALQELFNEVAANDESTAQLLFADARTTRLRAKMAGPLRRRGYLKATGEMLKHATLLSEDATLLKQIADEARIIVDLLTAEFELERQALEEDQRRLLMSLMGSVGPVPRVISAEDDTPISAEGGGVLNPEDG